MFCWSRRPRSLERELLIIWKEVEDPSFIFFRTMNTVDIWFAYGAGPEAQVLDWNELNFVEVLQLCVLFFVGLLSISVREEDQTQVTKKYYPLTIRNARKFLTSFASCMIRLVSPRNTFNIQRSIDARHSSIHQLTNLVTLVFISTGRSIPRCQPLLHKIETKLSWQGQTSLYLSGHFWEQ